LEYHSNGSSVEHFNWALLGLTSGWAVGPIRINLDPRVTPQFPSQKDFRKFMFNFLLCGSRKRIIRSRFRIIHMIFSTSNIWTRGDVGMPGDADMVYCFSRGFNFQILDSFCPFTFFLSKGI
jgi:hypothetical protein